MDKEKIKKYQQKALELLGKYYTEKDRIDENEVCVLVLSLGYLYINPEEIKTVYEKYCKSRPQRPQKYREVFEIKFLEMIEEEDRKRAPKKLNDLAEKRARMLFRTRNIIQNNEVVTALRSIGFFPGDDFKFDNNLKDYTEEEFVETIKTTLSNAKHELLGNPNELVEAVDWIINAKIFNFEIEDEKQKIIESGVFDKEMNHRDYGDKLKDFYFVKEKAGKKNVIYENLFGQVINRSLCLDGTFNGPLFA